MMDEIEIHVPRDYYDAGVEILNEIARTPNWWADPHLAATVALAHGVLGRLRLEIDRDGCGR